VLGWAPHGYLTRDRCRVGHDLYVTGTLGLAALGLRALRARRTTDSVAIRRFLMPPLRGNLARALARTALCGGMIDVSDGCLQDLQHLCAASRVGAEIEVERIPLSAAYRRAYGTNAHLALGGGEDYELLFSARPALASRLALLARRHRCPITRIGRIVGAERGIRLVDRQGRSRSVPARGHDHFR
jgi:thiamine-monophosphate kinase